MPGPPELPRPEPSRRARDAVGEWVRWFGAGRLVASALSVIVVVAGVAWLVRAPAPPPEASLPVATPSGSVAGAGLPQPSGAEPAATPPSTVPAAPASIVVHVAGAVARPGLHTVGGGARVGDAVDAAGGPSLDADLDALNLAAPLADGERVYVPAVGEVDPAALPAGPPGTGATASPAGPVDLNTASAADLDGLPGVGPSTAQAIVDDRDRNGPFASVDDLDRVRGIGPAKLEALRELVTV